MGQIKTEDVAGYWVHGDLVCSDCFDDGKEEFDNLLLASEVEDDESIYVCDRCKKQIKE